MLKFYNKGLHKVLILLQKKELWHRTPRNIESEKESSLWGREGEWDGIAFLMRIAQD